MKIVMCLQLLIPITDYNEYRTTDITSVQAITIREMSSANSANILNRIV